MTSKRLHYIIFNLIIILLVTYVIYADYKGIINTNYKALYFVGAILLLVPVVAFYLFKSKIHPLMITSYYSLVFVLFYLGVLFRYSESYWWYDKLSSSFLGLMVGLMTLYFLSYYEGFDKFSILTLHLYLFAVPMGMIAVWEIIEYNLAIIINVDLQHSVVNNVYSMDDTMSDIIAGLIGITIVSILLNQYNRKRGWFNIIGYYTCRYRNDDLAPISGKKAAETRMIKKLKKLEKKIELIKEDIKNNGD